MRVLSADWVLPVEAAPLADAAVAVDGASIVGVGPRAEVLASFPGAAEERFAGAVLAPAFVNLHTHVEYASYAGFGDGLGFAGWLDLHIERKRRLDPDGMRAIAELGVAACLQSGVGTLVDASFSGDAVGAASACGIRAVVALEAFGVAEDAPAAASALEDRIARRDSEAGPLVEIAASPHAPYSASLALYELVVRSARAAGRRVVTHLAESRNELDWALHGTGPMARALVPPPGEHPVTMLAERGLLGPEMVVAHAVHVGPDQIAALARSGCVVAHCPRSNALLGCGTAPLRELREAGVPVGLGTDSPASALTLDMFEEMRAAILLARARERDPEALGAAAALRLATADGAAALGRSGELGVLRDGAAADVVAVRLFDTPFWPADDPTSALVYGGTPQRVLMTMVAGAVRYRADDGALARALTGAASARARMLLSHLWTLKMLFDPDRMKSWAKWVYLGLAVVFASGVVLGGVGGGVPYDISDIVGNNAADGTTSSASIEDLEKRTAANPKDVEAWRELSGAYQANDRPEDAIRALEKVVALQPRDTESQQSLANLLLGAGARAARESNEYFSLSSYLGQLSPTAQPFFGGTTSLGQALQSPFQQAEANAINVDVSRYQQKAAELSGKASEYYQQSLEPYKELTKLRPDDAQIWLFYGDAASQANDAALAIANYSKFLELAPDDIDAPRVKEIVKQLEAAQSTAATAAATTPATTVTVEAGGSTTTATN